MVAKKYVPPALRNLQDKSDLTRLEKQVKGQLNRLAESNLQSISRVIEDLYIRNSRNDMNQCMLKVLKSAIIIPNAITPERLVMEHAVFIGKYVKTTYGYSKKIQNIIHKFFLIVFQLYYMPMLETKSVQP